MYQKLMERTTVNLKNSCFQPQKLQFANKDQTVLTLFLVKCKGTTFATEQIQNPYDDILESAEDICTAWRLTYTWSASLSTRNKTNLQALVTLLGYNSILVVRS